jgi:hypothetical protein
MRFIQKAVACLWAFAVFFNVNPSNAQTTANTGWEIYGGSKKIY